jgi:hypothetical protein
MSAGLLAGQELAMAVESTYGSPSASDYTTVDVSGLSYTRIQAVRAEIARLVGQGAIPLYDTPLVSTSGAGQPPEIDMPYSAVDSMPVGVSRGDVPVTVPFRLPGGTAFASTALGQMVASSLGLVGTAAGAYQTVTAAVSATVYGVLVGEISEANPGDVVAWAGATGAMEFASVTSVDVALNRVTVTPAFSATPQVGDVIRRCSVAYPVIGARGATSLSWRYRDAARGVLVTGSRMRSLELGFAGSANSTAEARMLFSGPFRGDIPGATPSAGSAVGAGVTARRYGSVISGALSGIAPEAGARTVYGVQEWDARITVDTEPVGSATASVLQRTDEEITRVAVEARIRFADTQRSALLARLRGQIRATWVLPMQGPLGASGGAALIIPGGYIADLPADTMEDARSYTEVVVRGGSADIADTTGTPTAARGAWMMLAVCS